MIFNIFASSCNSVEEIHDAHFAHRAGFPVVTDAHQVEGDTPISSMMMFCDLYEDEIDQLRAERVYFYFLTPDGQIMQLSNCKNE